ncbi:MAG: hypothetical protein JXB48_24820 [Candidatus Latescibacteria bacterium]|nr:hypothetical protein [Candidatus Latescibacterota bacterium]
MKISAFFLIYFIFNNLSFIPSGNCESNLKPPAFFSYAWPIGPDTVRDFTSIDMQSITVIDIGPDSLSYPPSVRKSYPDEIYELWHNRGKKLVRRCYDRPFGENRKKVDTFTVNDLIERWSYSMEEPGVDGIAIDEFIRDTHAFVSVWVEALRIIRAKYPDKLIFCWIAGKGLNAKELHLAIRDYADYCMPEIYYRESAAKGFPDFDFPRFREAVDILEQNAPGLTSKILLGLGVHEKLFDDVPDIDYGDFIEAQIRCISNDPVLQKLPGLAFYAPMALSQKNIGRLDELIFEYYSGR